MTESASMTSTALHHVDAGNGVTYAYRRFGDSASSPPVVFLQHFRGNVDNWDPALVDGIATRREVILFDNAGVGGSSGTTPDTVEQMAVDAVAFLDALDLDVVDLFGFSLGGFVALELATTVPARVRRLVLAGTGPQGAPGMAGWSPEVVQGVVVDDNTAEGYLGVFYTGSPQSSAAGQAKASHLLAGLISDARLHIYPDASHGSIFQYADDAAARTADFLGT